jgi:hypothetical protein
MVVEATWLALQLIVLLSVLGLGPTLTLREGSRPSDILLVIPVGVAVGILGGAWLNVLFPASIALPLLLAASALFSAWAAWRRRQGLRALRGSVSSVGALLIVCLGVYLLALLPIFATGTFTLAGPGQDPIGYYIHLAQYYQGHAYLAHDGAAYGGIDYILGFAGAVTPGYGRLDAGLSTITGWSPLALLEPLDAFLLAASIPTVYLLARDVFGLARRAASLAAAATLVNNLTLFITAYGAVGEIESFVLLTPFVVLATRALALRATRDGILAGVVGAALLSIYIPSFLTAAVLVGGVVVLALAGGLRSWRGWASLRWLPVSAGFGLVLCIPQLLAMAHAGVPGTWFRFVRQQAAGLGIRRLPELPFLTATMPFTSFVHGTNIDGWQVVAGWVGTTFLMAALVAGLVVVIVRRRLEAAAITLAGAAYLAYLVLVSNYPYGVVKVVSYLTPVAACLLVTGALGIPGLVHRASKRFRAAEASLALAGAAALGVVSCTQLVSTVQMDQAILAGVPKVPAPYLGLNALARVVPVGSSVLLYNPDAMTAHQHAVDFPLAIYFLPDRRVDVAWPGAYYAYGPNLPLPYGVTTADTRKYDFVLASDDPEVRDLLGPGYRVYWFDGQLALTLFKRT